MTLRQGTLESVNGASVSAGESERVLLAGQVHGGCRSWRESFHGNVHCDGRFDSRPRRFCARCFQKCAPPMSSIPTAGFRRKPMSTQSGSEFNGPPFAKVHLHLPGRIEQSRAASRCNPACLVQVFQAA